MTPKHISYLYECDCSDNTLGTLIIYIVLKQRVSPVSLDRCIIISFIVLVSS